MIRKSNQRGFSLIELSVVLVILGMIMSLGLKLLPQVTERVKLKETVMTLEQTKEILIGYAMTHHRLPCPDTNTTPDGREGFNSSVSVTPCNESRRGFNLVAHTGYLPYLDLGLSSPVVDSSHRPILYSVSRMEVLSAIKNKALFDLAYQRNPNELKPEDYDIYNLQAGQPACYDTQIPDPGTNGDGATNYSPNTNDLMKNSSCAHSKVDNNGTNLFINRLDFCQVLTNADNEKLISSGNNDKKTGCLDNGVSTTPGVNNYFGCRQYDLNTKESALFTSVSTATDKTKTQPYSAVGCGQQDSNGKNLFANQAFVLVSSGVENADADSKGDLFDGENVKLESHYSGANKNLGFLNCFESPARKRSANYDDIVLAVSFNELRARLCN